MNPRLSPFRSFCFFLLTVLMLTPVFAVTFVDVTEEAGIDFQHVNGASDKKYIIETMSSGAAFFDFDNDGDLDIYFVNGAALPQSSYSRTSASPSSLHPRDNLYHVSVTAELVPTNKLFANNGDGTFTDVTAQAGVGDRRYGMGCVVGDIDNDGDADVYVTNFGANLLYRNNGDGTFTNVTSQAGVGDARCSASAAFFDYDLDGYLDLYVVNYLDYTLEKHRIWLGRTGLPTYCGPSFYFGEADILYHNNGDGTFTDVTQEMNVYRRTGKGLGVICGDVNDDGFPDIYVANDTRANFLYLNHWGRGFHTVSEIMGVAYNRSGIDEAGMGVDLGDYDRDGRFDIFVTNFSGETNTLYRNHGKDGFTDVTEAANLGSASVLSLGFGTKFFDGDNDGFLDLFVANGHINDLIEQIDEEVTYTQSDQFFLNNGDGTFTDVSLYSGSYFSTRKVGRGAAFGDYDNDGDIDILITNNGQSPVLLRNDGGNRQNWLKIQAIGTSPPALLPSDLSPDPSPTRRGEKVVRGVSPFPLRPLDSRVAEEGGWGVRSSNRDGIGAQIKVVVGELAQIEEVRSGGSYLSDHDRRVHFGLGETTQVDRVEIRWPSQVIDKIENVPANHLLVVTEGAGHRLVKLGQQSP